MKRLFYIAVAISSIAGNCATPATKPYVDSLVFDARNEARTYTDSSVSNAYAELERKIDEHTYDIYKGDSILIGHGADTEGGIDVVVGGEASATGMASVAIGNASYVNGDNSVAVGASSVATNNGAVAIGAGATASHEESIALGSGAASNGDRTFSVSVPFDKWYAGGESVVGLLTNEVEGVYSEWVLTSSTLDTSSMTVHEEQSGGMYVYTLYEGTHVLATKSNFTQLTSVSFSFAYETISSRVNASRTIISYNNLGLLVGGYAIHVVEDKHGDKTATSFGNPYGEFGAFSSSFGIRTQSVGDYSHAEGGETVASGNRAHAEGYRTTASGVNSHVEGSSSIAAGLGSHAEGGGTIASNDFSHAEGRLTQAIGYYSHAEGYKTIASGLESHAEGCDTVASGSFSHASGFAAVARDISSYAWNGNTEHEYASHGEGTFNVNPLLGIDGFYIGEKNLKTIIEEIAPGGGGVSEERVGEIATNCINHLDAHFASEVLSVQIDTNTVAQIGELKEFFDGIPVGSVGTSIAGIILALLAAVAWLKKHAKETDARIDLIEATSHPNMNIVGSPTFREGNVSGFSENDYLVFPTAVSVGQNTVEFHMAFHTGSDVTTQQNIMDSWCGLAFAIRNGTTVTAISTNGTSFLAESTGGTIRANNSYRMKMLFSYESGQYRTRVYLADGAGDFVEVGTGFTADAPLYATATYWGGANPGHEAHVFRGIINLNECRMLVNDAEVWRGYDELPTVKFDPTATPRLDTAEKIVKVVEDAVSRDNRFLVGGSYSEAPAEGSPTTAAIQTHDAETDKWTDEIRIDKAYDALRGDTMVKLDKSVQTITVAGSNLVIKIPESIDGTVRDLCVYVNNSSDADTALTFPAGTYYGDDPNGAVAKAGKVTAIYLTEIPKDVWMLRIVELEQFKVEETA